MIGPSRRAMHDKAVETIARIVDERGYPPSVRELGAELGYRSSGAVHLLLVELEAAGRIRRGAGPRAIAVVREGSR